MPETAETKRSRGCEKRVSLRSPSGLSGQTNGTHYRWVERFHNRKSARCPFLSAEEICRGALPPSEASSSFVKKKWSPQVGKGEGDVLEQSERGRNVARKKTRETQKKELTLSLRPRRTNGNQT